MKNRFDYEGNRRASREYGHRWSAFWPAAPDYEMSVMNLTDWAPTSPDLQPELSRLRDVIEAQWSVAKQALRNGEEACIDAPAIAEALRVLSTKLTNESDVVAATLRAHALVAGYTDEALKALTGLDERIAVVAGSLSTWFGKQKSAMPTAFAAVVDDSKQRLVEEASGTLADVAQHMAKLHAHLALDNVPEFAATNVFFMAGEGNAHPKHIAYFLPEDEGVKRSSYKKSYYFGNTHDHLVAQATRPLAEQFLGIGSATAANWSRIAPLGVYAHEVGHAVRRSTTTHAELNRRDRWASVALQEAAADVFGALVLTEVWAATFRLDVGDVVAYYLGECLRYTARGLGLFPDSDGMLFQLSYLAHFGALSLRQGADGPVLDAQPSVVVAGLRSLGRVLADTLLNSAPDSAVRLFERFGPMSGSLDTLISALDEIPARTIEYEQETHASTHEGPGR